MRARLTPGFVTAATLAIAAIGIAPTIAEAQGRGTMQVSARVVSADNAFRSLDAARAAIREVSQPTARDGAEAVPTVARVALVRDRHAVVVTIDYSRN
jgi:hypothetical protein